MGRNEGIHQFRVEPAFGVPLTLSARSILGARSRGRLLTGFALTALVTLQAPALAVPVLHWSSLAFFAAAILFRASLVLIAILPAHDRRQRAQPLSDDDLPTYTIMVAMYRERRAVPGLIQALSRLDYPVGKREVLLLIEMDDAETSEALQRVHLPEGFHVVAVPWGHPRTKPRALNFGLEHASGDCLVIYDAEDRPHPQQLRAAAQAFRRPDRRLACVQAPLTAYNDRESWMAAQWGLEYLIHFNLILPALARLRLPIPLGGTSNHFRTNVLKRVSGWDAWNVTEDADLGLRLHQLGFRVGTITPATREEAPIHFRAWAAQRSRWIKGHAQSWLVAIRAQSARATEDSAHMPGLRSRDWLAVHFTLLAGVVSAMLHGVLALWLALVLLRPELSVTRADLAVLVAGLSVNAVAGMLAMFRTGQGRWHALLTQPVYWPLLTIAAARAVFGLFHKPHFWAKTEHGLTRFESPGEPAVALWPDRASRPLDPLGSPAQTRPTRRTGNDHDDTGLDPYAFRNGGVDRLVHSREQDG